MKCPFHFVPLFLLSTMISIEKLRFLDEETTRKIAKEFGTPVFVYSEKLLRQRADEVLAFPHAFEFIPRFAMKANPSLHILAILREKGFKIDASSEHEITRALRAGFKPEDVLLSSQQLAKNLKSIVESGTEFNACSLHQLEEFGKHFPGGSISMRFNPGLGSGATKKTDVGGTTSSFGIWNEKMDQVKEIIEKYRLKVKRVHTHIGSGSDPEVWKAVAKYTLEYAEMFPTTEIVNMGGGFKVGRMSDEKSVDLQKIGEPVKEQFLEFERKHQKKLKFEIEPGSYLVVNSGSLVTTIDDIVDTGKNGMTFYKLDAGMDSNTRPSLYAARHPLVTVGKTKTSSDTIATVIVGHCCESGDVFTQKEGGAPITRDVNRAEIGDLMVMEGVGAYCSSMSTKNYNSFPEIPEVMLETSGNLKLIRKKQSLDQIWQNEIPL